MVEHLVWWLELFKHRSDKYCKTLHYFKVVSVLSLIVGWNKKVEHKLSFTVSHHLSICSNGCGAKPTFRLYVCYISSYFGPCCFKQSCTGQHCHLKSEEKRERGGLERWIWYYCPLPPSSLVPLSMSSIRGPRASGSVAQINLTLSNTCLTFEFCKLPTFLDIKGVQAFFADICADIYNCQKRLGLFCEGPLLIF